VTPRDPYARYQVDPVAFMVEQLRFEPWSKQREIAEAVRDHDRVAVRSCNSGGKSAIAACTALGWLAGGPSSIVVTTSSTEKQLKRVLWREIGRCARKASGFFRGAQITDLEVFLAEDWYCVGLSVDETESMQGFHAERVLVVVDEASGVSEDVFAAIEGLMAGGQAHLLLIANPLRTSGTFYDAFHRDRDEYRLITIDAFSTPNFTGERVSREARKKLVSPKWVDRLGRKRGLDSNEYAVRVLAQFPSAATDDQVVAPGDLARAHAQRFAPGLPLVVGVDVARFGSDSTVLAVRRGNVIRVAKSYQGRDLMRTAGEVTDLARTLHREHGRKPTLVIDDVGLGGGVVDRLRELREFRVVDFNAGRKASSRDYLRARDELWFRLAELLPVLDLDPGDEELAADLLAPTYTLTSDAKRVVEPKAATRKRLRRSPDRADAVMLTLTVDPPRAPGRPHRPRRTTSVARGQILPRSRHPLARRPATVAADAAVARAVGIPLYDPAAGLGIAAPAAPAEPAAALDVSTHDPAELAGYLSREGA